MNQNMQSNLEMIKLDINIADLIKDIIVGIFGASAQSFGGALAFIVAGWLYSAFILLAIFLICVIYYIISAKAISKIAEDQGLTDHRIFAWIPILRVVRLFEIVDFKVPWWLNFFYIVVISLFFQLFFGIMILVLWIKIAHIYLKRTGEAVILGLLFGLPVLNIILAVYFAYYYKEEHITSKPKTLKTSSLDETLPQMKQNDAANTDLKHSVEKIEPKATEASSVSETLPLMEQTNMDQVDSEKSFET
jgi:hypothetical protein